MTQFNDLLERIVEECHSNDIIYSYSAWLVMYLQDFDQYPIVKEYIYWDDDSQIAKDGYSNSDMKLYWYVRQRAKSVEEMKTLLYVEGLILLHISLLSADYFTIACLKIFTSMTDVTIIQALSIDDVASVIRATYDYIIANKEEILSGYKTWRPDPRHRSSDSKKVFRKSKEQFIKLLDECKEMTGHRSYSFCLQYFIQKTGLSTTTFKNYVKEYNIVFDDIESAPEFDRTKCGRKKMTSHYSWLDEIHGEEWKLSIEEISKLLVKRDKTLREDIDNPYSECVLTKTAIKNWKYKKMKELGLKKTEHKKTEEKKKTIPDIRMEFSNHQAAEIAPTADTAIVIAEKEACCSSRREA